MNPTLASKDSTTHASYDNICCPRHWYYYPKLFLVHLILITSRVENPAPSVGSEQSTNNLLKLPHLIDSNYDDNIFKSE